MRLIAVLIVCLFSAAAGAAFATSYADVDNAKQLINELRALQSTRDAQANQIIAVTVEAQVKTGNVEREYRLTFKQTDANWTAMLSGINQAITGRIAAIKTTLQGMSVTNVPN